MLQALWGLQVLQWAHDLGLGDTAAWDYAGEKLLTAEPEDMSLKHWAYAHGLGHPLQLLRVADDPAFWRDAPRYAVEDGNMAWLRRLHRQPCPFPCCWVPALALAGRLGKLEVIEVSFFLLLVPPKCQASAELSSGVLAVGHR